MSSFDYKIGKRSYKYDLSQLSDEEKKKFIGLTRPQKMKYIKEHGGHQKNEVKAGQAIPTEPPIGFAPTKPLYTLPSVSIDDNKTIDDSNDSDKQHDLIDLMYIRNNADKIINGEDTKYQKEDIAAFLDKGKTKFDDDKWTKAYNARYNALPKKKQQLVKDKDFVDAVKNASPMDLDEIRDLLKEVKSGVKEVNRGRTVIDMLKMNEYAVPLDMKIGDLQHILAQEVQDEKTNAAKGVVRLYKFVNSYSGPLGDSVKDMTIREYVEHVLKEAKLNTNELNFAQLFAQANGMIGQTAMVKGQADAQDIADTLARARPAWEAMRKEMKAFDEAHGDKWSEDEEDEKKEENNKSISTPSEWKNDLPMNPEQWKKDKPEKKNRKWRKLLNSYIRYLVGKCGFKSESPEYKHLAEIEKNAENTSAWFDGANAAFDYVKSLLETKGKGFPKKQLQGKSRALQLISKTGSKMPSKKQLHKCLNKKEIKELYGLMQGGSVSKTVQSSPHWSIKIKGGAMELTQYNNNTLSLSSPSELSEYNTSATALANSASTNAVIPAGATWKSVSDDMMALASLATGTKPAEVVEQLNKMNRVRAEIAHRDYVNKFVPANLRSKTIQRIPLKAAMIATDAIKKKEITDKVINDIRGYPGLSKQQSDALRSLLKMKGNRVKQFKKILGIN